MRPEIRPGFTWKFARFFTVGGGNVKNFSKENAEGESNISYNKSFGIQNIFTEYPFVR